MVEVEPVWATLLSDFALVLPALATNPFTALQSALLALFTGLAIFGGG